MRQISQRELRNESGAIMRAINAGESFVVTSNSVPIAELSPLHGSTFVRSEIAVGIFENAPLISYAKLRSDLDAVADPAAHPRA